MTEPTEKPKTNITRKHLDVFDVLTSGEATGFALTSAMYQNGAGDQVPVVAIVAIGPGGDSEHVSITPLAVLLQGGEGDAEGPLFDQLQPLDVEDGYDPNGEIGRTMTVSRNKVAAALEALMSLS